MARILAIDDKEDNLISVSAVLKGYIPGCKVITALSGPEGIEKAKLESPDVILLDIKMPGMDGYEICKRLKEDEKTNRIPVIMIPAVLTGTGDFVKGLDIGADAYLAKPIDEQVLIAQVKTALRMKAAEDSIHRQKDFLEDMVRERTADLEKTNAQLKREIDERKQMEDVLRKSEAENRYKAELLQNAPVLAAFHDLENNIVWANRAYEEATGLSLREIKGRKCFSAWGLPTLCRNCPAVKAMETGESQESELTLENQDHWPESQGYWLSRGAPVRDVQGNIIGAIEIALDITDRKTAELERERLMAAIEQAGEIVVITDPEGTIQYVNPAFEKITGYTRQESIGKTPRMLKSGKQDEAFYRNLWNSIADGRIWKGRMVNKRKDGTFYTEESTVSPVRNVSGKIVNYVAVKRDISETLRADKERSELQDQLQQSQKVEAIGNLAGGIAHDFNNMLSVIIGYGENIIEKLHPGDPLREDAQEILEAGRRSASLTRQLLAFSRKQTLQPEVLDLNEILHDLEKMLARVIGEDIELEMKLSKDLYRVMADPGQIEQVIMNLAVNSRDGMPDGGSLIIETVNTELDEAYASNHVSVTPGKFVMLALTDNGCGMDKETLSKIFDPFFTTKEKGKGTGLGLSTVYGIVKQSGGNIWTYSEPGKGTTFKIYLPRTEAEPEMKVKAVVEEQEKGGGEHILVVEDDASLRRLCSRILSNLGYRITLAANGGEALLEVEEKGFKPDLVVTDVVMPGMSGKVLVDRLRKTMPELKVLYMSGYTDNAIVHHGVLDPGTPFIQKPFNTRDFGAKVQDVLRGGAGGAR